MERRGAEIIRGASALLALAVLILGVPAGLVSFVGWPLPTDIPTWPQVSDVVTRGQVDDWTLVKALALLIWLAWGHLASSVASEAVAFARGRRARRIPGPSPLQVAATNLVASATLLSTGLIRPTAAAALDDLPELRTLVVDPGTPRPEVGDGPRVASNGAPNAVDWWREVTPHECPTAGDDPVWTVRPRDTLWEIAERTLGDGLRWRDIHRLNVNRPQADGHALQPGVNHIQPGWVLQLPADAATHEVPDDAGPAESGDEASDSVTVERGDTLWELADEHLDSAYDWPKLYQQNQGRVQPDGQRLTDPDVIHPGWRLDLPDGAAADGPAHTTTVTQPEVEEAPSPPLMRDPAPPLSPPRVDQPTPPAPAQGHAAATPSPVPEPLGTRGETGTPQDGAEEIQGDLWDEAFALAGFGIAAAGVAATLDRIRHAHRRRRHFGQRIRLPQPPLAETELRIRGLADEATAQLVDAALLSLISSCESTGQPAPEIVLVSTSAEDVAVHLAEARFDPPEGWRCEDDGMTWVLPQGHQPAEPVAPSQRDATTLPLLVSIGTTAHGQRRVLLNLRHASLIGVDADRETRRTLLLGHAVELATTMAFGALRVVMVGFGEVLEALERIQLVEDAEEAVALLARLADEARALGGSDAGAADVEPAVGLFLEPLGSELMSRLKPITAVAEAAVAAVVAGQAGSAWQLRDRDGVWHFAPYNVEVERLELTGAELERVGALVLDAKQPSYVAAPPAEEPSPQETGEQTDGTPTQAITDLVRDASPVEVRILGPVAVTGVERFPTAKAQELVVYLATHREGADADTLMEALWPGQPPNPQRLHTEVWRARQTLGDAPDGEPYLPRVDRGRYRLSPRVGLDYDRFRKLIARARQRPELSVSALHSALELVHGRPLSIASGEYVWATYDVHAIAQEIGDAAHQLAEAYLQQGDLERATWAAEQGLQADPYLEILYRDLMKVAAEAGNTSGVRAAVGRLRQVVDDDCDGNDADDWLEPETVRLYEQLTHGS